MHSVQAAPKAWFESSSLGLWEGLRGSSTSEVDLIVYSSPQSNLMIVQALGFTLN